MRLDLTAPSGDPVASTFAAAASFALLKRVSRIGSSVSVLTESSLSSSLVLKSAHLSAIHCSERGETESARGRAGGGHWYGAPLLP